MITRDNFKDVVLSFNAKERKRIRRYQYDKELAYIELHIFNGGGYATIRCTNNYDLPTNNGQALVELQEVLDIIDNDENIK